MAMRDDRAAGATGTSIDSAPPLEAGDRLTRAEFHRRYLRHPEIKKAELIDGVVYMPSPVRLRRHGEPHAWVVAWLGQYAASRPGLRLADNATVLLGPEDEVQPDALLMVDPAAGGQTRSTPGGYLEGAPELVVEVAASTASYDLHAKREAYRRAGVLEYLVILTFEGRVLWLVRAGESLVELGPGADGLLRSPTFPGLWLDPTALLQGDLARLLAAGRLGIDGAAVDPGRDP